MFFILFLTYTVDAYELISFSQNRIRSPQEILKETGIQIFQLDTYHCEASHRMELFTDNDDLAQTKSLWVKNGDKKILYQNKPCHKEKDKFICQAMNTLFKLETIPEIRTLIEKLQMSKIPFVIQNGRSSYSPNFHNEKPNLYGNNAGFVAMMDDLRPMVEKLPFNAIGHGGTIYWNPEIKAEFIEEDGVKRKVDALVVLAHEMYHAYDGMRGLLDRRFVKSDEHEFITVAEYRATYFENIARKALGYKFRKYYSEPTDLNSEKDMLDDSGMPIFLPSPCIKWVTHSP